MKLFFYGTIGALAFIFMIVFFINDDNELNQQSEKTKKESATNDLKKGMSSTINRYETDVPPSKNNETIEKTDNYSSGDYSASINENQEETAKKETIQEETEINSTSDNPSEKEISVTEMDTDRDGYITPEEYIGEPSLFDFYDDNKDGIIGPDDIDTMYRRMEMGVAAQKKHYQQTIDQKDLNGDGELSIDELENMPEEVFLKIDTNRDSFITIDEIEDNQADFYHPDAPG